MNIDMTDPDAVRAALRAKLGVMETLPPELPELLELFKATSDMTTSNEGSPLRAAASAASPGGTGGQGGGGISRRTEARLANDDSPVKRDFFEDARLQDLPVQRVEQVHAERDRAIEARDKAQRESQALRQAMTEAHARRIVSLVASWRPTVHEPKAPALSQFGSLSELKLLITTCTAVLSTEPRLLRLPRPCTVIGDIHGCFDDMMAALRHGPGALFSDAMTAALRQGPGADLPSSATDEPVLFLGDYIDKGPSQLQCMWALIALKVVYPTRVFLLRGNHEWASQKQRLITTKQPAHKWSESFNKAMEDYFGAEHNDKLDLAFYGDIQSGSSDGLFTELALGACIGDDVLVLHAGIGRELQAPTDLDERLWPRSWKLSMRGNQRELPERLLMTKAIAAEEKLGTTLPEHVGAAGSDERKAYGKAALRLLWDVMWSDPTLEAPGVPMYRCTDGSPVYRWDRHEKHVQADVYPGGRGGDLLHDGWPETTSYGLTRRLPGFMAANHLRVLIRGHQHQLQRTTSLVETMALPASPTRQLGSAYLVTVHTGRFNDVIPTSHVVRVAENGEVDLVDLAVVAGDGAAPDWQPLISIDGHVAASAQERRALPISRDRFALYLRPLDANGEHLIIPGASESQERWGGLHCTLCSFAPALDSGAPDAHSGAVPAALERGVRAMKDAAPPGGWTIAHDASLSDDNDMLKLPADASLEALCAAVADAGMSKARKTKTLHISIDDAEPEVCDLAARTAWTARTAARTAAQWTAEQRLAARGWQARRWWQSAVGSALRQVTTQELEAPLHPRKVTAGAVEAEAGESARAPPLRSEARQAPPLRLAAR